MGLSSVLLTSITAVRVCGTSSKDMYEIWRRKYLQVIHKEFEAKQYEIQCLPVKAKM